MLTFNESFFLSISAAICGLLVAIAIPLYADNQCNLFPYVPYPFCAACMFVGLGRWLRKD